MGESFRLEAGPGTTRTSFGGHDPVLRVQPGSVVELTTEDCYGGRVTSVEDVPSEVTSIATLNPVTGPIHVEGAEPGDVLAVHLAEIVPRRDWAISSTFPHFGALTGTATTALLGPALEERVWRYDIDVEAWTATFRARRSGHEVVLPLDPFHGTIGVAPAAGERLMSITPGPHGGNLDTPEARAGTTIYLPVFEPGALLGVGDGHCRQGEGEVCGTAIEAAMRTTIVVDVVKGGAIGWPRLEDDGHIMTTGSTRPLEDAFRVSQKDLVDWVAQLIGMDALDALQLVSQTVTSPIANVVDTNYTVVARMAKEHLPAEDPFDGIHARLRAVAREHLRAR